ncbi:MAG: hypothetical protein ACI8TX_000307 [Hyphomicrobiaceae bacterium]
MVVEPSASYMPKVANRLSDGLAPSKFFPMRNRVFSILAFSLLILGGLIRLQNAVSYPSLRGYDAFGHASYIWLMAETWRVPDPTSGWSYFHPPLYYAFAASLWKACSGWEPQTRLSLIAGVVSFASLFHAVAAWSILRRHFAEHRAACLLGFSLMLFVPVHLYSAPFLGNEGLTAILCTAALWRTSQVLENRSGLAGWASVGVLLGLAMLGKFSAVVIVASVVGTAVVDALVRGRWGTAVTRAGVLLALVAVISGWFYARNIENYGNPFQLSRDAPIVAEIESTLTSGRRGLGEYLLFDPGIFFRPQWPRGIPLAAAEAATIERSSMRESVWTGLYANAWFDGFGGWVLPKVTESEIARRSGQLLLTLGLVPTLLVLLGLASTCRKLLAGQWQPTSALMSTSLVGMGALFVYGTYAAPVHAAVKATYFVPVALSFAWFSAQGLVVLKQHARGAATAALSISGIVLALSAVVFTQGLVTGVRAWDEGSIGELADNNLWGVLEFAVGHDAHAEERFRAAAAHSYGPAYENLATIAVRGGQPQLALSHLAVARELARESANKTPGDPTARQRRNIGEVENSIAVIEASLGRRSAAVAAARTAAAAQAQIPEAAFNLAALLFGELGDPTDDTPQQQRARTQAFRHIEDALNADAGFREALLLRARMHARAGSCGTAEFDLATVRRQPHLRRAYPLPAGQGLPYEATIGRRDLLPTTDDLIDPVITESFCP